MKEKDGNMGCVEGEYGYKRQRRTERGTGDESDWLGRRERETEMDGGGGVMR